MWIWSARLCAAGSAFNFEATAKLEALAMQVNAQIRLVLSLLIWCSGASCGR
jgi:hypothetical protein